MKGIVAALFVAVASAAIAAPMRIGGVGPMTICSLMKNTLAAGKKEYYN